MVVLKNSQSLVNFILCGGKGCTLWGKRHAFKIVQNIKIFPCLAGKEKC